MSDVMGGIASGLNALMSEYNSVAHNIANSSTPGFKKQMTSFSSTLNEAQGNDIVSPLAANIEAKDTFDFTQGQLLQTQRTLDIGLEGSGFLALETPGGKFYTRNGSLQINILGQLTDTNGHLVAGQKGAITIPKTVSERDIQISSTGKIRAGILELGQLQVVEFEDMSELKAAGNGCFTGPEIRRPKAPENTLVRQGYREDSNVQTVQELTNMLTLSRMFQANTGFMKKQSENSKVILGVAST
ncbi:MAG: flagellar hook-basal body protein [Planctomycetota bacterium]|jgi:flagellar basal body rod protein FlgG